MEAFFLNGRLEGSFDHGWSIRVDEGDGVGTAGAAAISGAPQGDAKSLAGGGIHVSVWKGRGCLLGHQRVGSEDHGAVAVGGGSADKNAEPDGGTIRSEGGERGCQRGSRDDPLAGGSEPADAAASCIEAREFQSSQCVDGAARSIGIGEKSDFIIPVPAGIDPSPFKPESSVVPI